MKEKLKSLRIRMLLPVIVMAVFVVTMLTTLFSRAYISMIVQQEQEVNDAGFETVSRSVTQLINTAVVEMRNIMSDDRVAGYASLQYATLQDQIHAAAKNLKKECSSETFPRFIDRLKVSFGSSRCVYIKNSGDDLKCLNESEEDKIDVLAVNFLQELQKLCSPTDDVAKAVMPAKKIMALSQALSGSEPKIREACILAVEIIQAVASGKEGNGGSQW